MGEGSKIEWTHHTFNPWWGCVRVSPGCEHCYAETFAKRTGHGVWGHRVPRRFFGEKHWNEPRKWNASAAARGVRERVFCASMADVFEVHADPEIAAEMEEARELLWALIEETPSLDWLLLTKRPANVLTIAPTRWERQRPRNVWLGVTAEDQRRANERIPHLLALDWPAVVFVSYEPALEQVDFGAWMGELRVCGPKPMLDATRAAVGDIARAAYRKLTGRRSLDWIIVGGESGPGARPFDVAWARSTIAQCRAAGVAVNVKQLGAHPLAPCGRCRGDGIDPVPVDGDPEWCGECGGAAQSGLPAARLKLKDRKGGDWWEWPSDLRVREFPTVHLDEEGTRV